MKRSNKNKLHRIAAYMCTVALLLTVIGNLGVIASEATDINPNEALIVFEKKLKTVNVENIIMGNNDMASYSVTDDGVDVWKFKPSGKNLYFYIDLPNSFRDSYYDGSEYDVEVKYFDSNTGYAIFWYDAEKWGKQVAYELYANATNTWKTAKFTLDNACFKNGVDGKGDIMMSFQETGGHVSVTPFPVDVASIKITRKPKANPILAESYVDPYGNVFAYYSKEKTVHNEIKNTDSRAHKINVEYSLVEKELGDKVFSKTESITVPACSTVKTDVNIESEQCGIFNWYVRITNDDGTINSSFKEDLIAVVKTDPNGIRSEFSNICTHATAYRPDASHALLQLISMANFGGVRMSPGSSLRWENLERIPGKLEINDASRSLRALEQAKLLGFNVLLQLGCSHAWYQGMNAMSGASNDMPNNKIAYDGFERYSQFVIQNLAPYVDYWEIWNEPNIKSFNLNGGTPEDLTEITKRVRRLVNKYDPEALTVGMNTTALTRNDGITWRDGLFNAGIVDGDNGMNVMGVHPYTFTGSPEDNRMHYVLNDYKDMALEYGKDTGVTEMPVFSTEYGYSTADKLLKGGKALAYPLRQVLMLKAHGVADKTYYYVMEQCGIIDIDREDNFGLVTFLEPKYNIEGKIAVATDRYAAFAGMNYVMGGHCVEDGAWELDDEIYMNRFKSDKFDKNILTLWHDNEDKSLSLDLGVDSVDCYDVYGNKKTVYGKNGIFTFIITGRPLYVVGNFKKNRVVNYSPVVKYNSLHVTAPVKDKAYIVAEVDSDDDDYEVVFSSHGADVQSFKTRVENGKAEYYMNVDGEVGDKSAVDVEVYKGGNRISYAQIPITIGNALGSELSFELADKNNVNNWNGILKLTNNCFDSETKGYVEFSQPAEFVELGKIDIGTVPPNSTKDVVFNIPNLYKKGIKNVDYKIYIENSDIEPLEYTLQKDFNIAVQPLKKVVIDGKADEGEWRDGISMSAEGPANFVGISGFECKDANDKSANVSIMWDDENLYMYTEVIDDIYYQKEAPEKAYIGDSIQFGLYVDMNEEEFTALGQSDTNFHEYTISINKDSNAVDIYKTRVQDNRTQTGMVKANAKALRRGTVTTYEFAIPWEQIVGVKDWHPVAGQYLKFSMLWNDNDGEGRKGWIEYASGIGSSKDTKLFTKLLFVG